MLSLSSKDAKTGKLWVQVIAMIELQRVISSTSQQMQVHTEVLTVELINSVNSFEIS